MDNLLNVNTRSTALSFSYVLQTFVLITCMFPLENIYNTYYHTHILDTASLELLVLLRPQKSARLPCILFTIGYYKV
jgi:hypothetical protein